AHRDEIDRWQARADQERLTIVPLKLYFREGRAKLELGLARGRKTIDKRQAIAQRTADREAAREIARARRQPAD
ncbi:MAG: SsrA-binding protein, partial [Acidimicrobiales bacterium]|nr:SsrA-binding protein [Acidimicrobiales bacterium]